jgi:hypothetical protein
MQITLEIPDDLALPLLRPGQDPARAALEALAIEAYRNAALLAINSARFSGLGHGTNSTDS